jgi:hypothetical protein
LEERAAGEGGHGGGAERDGEERKRGREEERERGREEEREWETGRRGKIGKEETAKRRNGEDEER